MNDLKPHLDSLKDTPPEKKSSQCYKMTVDRNAQKVPPDGGWGWMIVLGSSIGLLLSTFPVSAFSILYSPILMSHEVSSAKTSWIFNVYTLVWSLTTLFIGPLCDEFGWRKVAIFGGIANFLSVVLSAFTPNAEFLFFSFSLLGGVGVGVGLTLSLLVVSRYFEKHRGLALGITSLGGCASTFLGPILANYLLENYGYVGASLIFGAIVLNQCLGGALYQPIEWHMKYKEIEMLQDHEGQEKLLSSRKDSNDFQEEYFQEFRRTSVISRHSKDSISYSSTSISFLPTLLGTEAVEHETSKNTQSTYKFWAILKSTFNNLKSLKYIRVNLIVWGYCGLMLGYANFYMWVPFVITNAGYSLETAAWCSSYATTGNVVGRIVMTFISDRKFFNVRYGFMFGLFLIGSSIIAFSLVDDIKLYNIIICGWGLGIGSTIALNVMVMIEVMGIEMLPTVLGVAALFQGFGGITLGTLVGVIRDATSSYTYSLWMLGGCEFVAFLLWLLMPCAQKYDEKKYPKDKGQREDSEITKCY
ncbi:UNVERIFIED_CONTAM: hypothetical protein RMT77_009395 [Armadillidium vulgare]